MSHLLILLMFPVVFSAISYFLLKYWVKLRRETAFLTAVATGLASGGTVAWRAYQFDRLHIGPQNEMALLIFACTALLVIFAVPLGLKLYRAWTGIQVSPEEQCPGGTGVRAWLTPGNLIVSALVAGCAAGAFDYQFMGVFALLIGCLLIQPLINTASVPAPAPLPSTGSPLTAEREKVLSLLESGKITVEESSDLLNALGSSSQVVKSGAPVSRQQRMILIGAGLVLLGFFLPWLSYNPGKELTRMTGQMQGTAQGFMPEGMSMPGMPTIATQTLNFSGGDTGKGLGWLVLLLGLGVATLPHVAATMDTATRRMISFISLGIGGIILLWLVTQNLRLLNIGLIVVLAGYAVEFLALLNPRDRSLPSQEIPAA